MALMAPHLLSWPAFSAENDDLSISFRADVVPTSYFYPFEAELRERVEPRSGMFDPGLSEDWGDLLFVDPFSRYQDWDLRKVQELGVWEWEAQDEPGAHRPKGTTVRLDPSEYNADVLDFFFNLPTDQDRRELLAYRDEELAGYFHRLIETVKVDYAGVYFGEADYIYWGKSIPSARDLSSYVNEAIRMKLRAFDERILSGTYRTLAEKGWSLEEIRANGPWEWRVEVVEDHLIELDPSNYSAALISKFFSLDAQTRARVLQFRADQLNKLSAFLSETVEVREDGLYFGDGLYMAWLGEGPSQDEHGDIVKDAIRRRFTDFDRELFNLSSGVYVRNAWDLPAARQLGTWEWRRQSRDGLLVEIDPSDHGAEALQTFFEVGDQKRSRFLRLRESRLDDFFERVSETLYVDRRGIYFDGKAHLYWDQDNIPAQEEIPEIVRNLVQDKLTDFDAQLFSRVRDPFVENGWDLLGVKELGTWEWHSYFRGDVRVELNPSEYDENFLRPFFNLSPEHQRVVLEYRNRELNAMFRKMAQRTYVDKRGLWVDGRQRHEVNGRIQHLEWTGNSLAEAGVKDITRRIFERKMRERDQQIFYTSKVIADKNEVAFVIKAQGVAVFWLPNLGHNANHKNIRGGAKSVTLIVGRHRGLIELDL
ncbi:MAG: hypothetical protein AAF202_06950, partial [Pseudomonadota bacterium]